MAANRIARDAARQAEKETAATNIQRGLEEMKIEKIMKVKRKGLKIRKIPQLETAKQISEYRQTQQERQNARERISSALLRSKLQPVVSEAIEEVE